MAKQCFYGAVLLGNNHGSMMVEQSTLNHRLAGSNPATGTGREKVEKRFYNRVGKFHKTFLAKFTPLLVYCLKF
jgi:hypothetical protein